MGVIVLLILIILVIILLLFTVPADASLEFKSQEPYAEVTVLWLYPVLKALMLYSEKGPVLEVRLFKGKVYQKNLQNGKKESAGWQMDKMELVRSLRLFNVEVKTIYGFQDPSSTGVACGAFSILSQFINIDKLLQQPDFTAEEDYIYLEAKAKINIGLTAINLIRAYMASSRKQIAYQSR